MEERKGAYAFLYCLGCLEEIAALRAKMPEEETYYRTEPVPEGLEVAAARLFREISEGWLLAPEIGYCTPIIERARLHQGLREHAPRLIFFDKEEGLFESEAQEIKELIGIDFSSYLKEHLQC